DCFEKKHISVDHIHPDENVADLLTKPFDAGRFQYIVSEHNVDFHLIVDFVEASPLRIETMEKGTKILATVDGILGTVIESSLRRNLKLKDEEGISSLLDAERFENLTLMGYNISPNQKQYTKRTRIAQSSVLLPVADEPAYPLRDGSQCEACPTDSGFVADQDRANITKTSTLPSDLAPRVTSLAADEGKRSGDDAPIKGRRLDVGEEVAERVSDDTEEMATVLTSMDAAIVLSSGVAKVPTGSGSIPTIGLPATEVPTGSDVVPTAGLIFATATVVTPYIRRKGKEKMIESETLRKRKIQE
nr:hypothetical protein [Tanacetum cinerariifolium]